MTEPKILKICGYGTVFHYKDFDSDIIKATSNISFEKCNPDIAKIMKCKFLLPMKYDHDKTIGYWNYCQRTPYGIFFAGSIYTKYMDIYKKVLDSKIFLSISAHLRKATKYKCNDVIARYLEDIEIIEVSLTTRPSNKLCGCIKYQDENG